MLLLLLAMAHLPEQLSTESALFQHNLPSAELNKGRPKIVLGSHDDISIVQSILGASVP